MTTPASAIFVYGTLRPGESRWPHLAPFVVDDGWNDSTAGRLFDTGRGYPAALFDPGGPGGVRPGPRIVGQTFVLLQESRSRALDVLDEIEGALRPIASGDWIRQT